MRITLPYDINSRCMQHDPTTSRLLTRPIHSIHSSSVVHSLLALLVRLPVYFDTALRGTRELSLREWKKIKSKPKKRANHFHRDDDRRWEGER